MWVFADIAPLHWSTSGPGGSVAVYTTRHQCLQQQSRAVAGIRLPALYHFDVYTGVLIDLELTNELAVPSINGLEELQTPVRKILDRSGATGTSAHKHRAQ